MLPRSSHPQFVVFDLLKASLPVAPHALPSTAASTGDSWHPSRASSVSTQVNARNLSAQVVRIVVVGSWLLIVATHLAMRHTRRSLVESA